MKKLSILLIFCVLQINCQDMGQASPADGRDYRDEFFNAIKMGDLYEAEALLGQRFVSPNEIDDQGDSALCVALFSKTRLADKLDILTLLLQNGADSSLVCAKTKSEPLIAAINHNLFKEAIILFEHTGDSDLRMNAISLVKSRTDLSDEDRDRLLAIFDDIQSEIEWGYLARD